MVGKIQNFNFLKYATKVHKRISQHDHTRLKDDDEPQHRRSVPLIASPLDPKATAWLRKKHETGNLTLKRRPTIAQFEADRFAGGIFRKQHEATTLELFFDLFFVANLAVFTNNHEHVSPESVGNYVGFFTILWFTWFHTSIFDVRFYVDSVFNRFCKLIMFGIFTAFTGMGPIYDSIMYHTSSRAFHALALVLAVSRFILLLQHATVLWYVRPFRKTVLPISLMMLVYLCTAMAFLATFVDDGGAGSIDYKKGQTHVIIWYVILAVEAILVIIISSIWRILSFKYTHLVERVGLLSLIIMGEGIIGLTKSVSYLLSGTNVSFWSIVGKVIAAVMLIYLVYILYFSPIDHDRFGTIRQQFWTLLHFPLHVSFLLAGEGSAVTLLWDAVIRARFGLRDSLPDLTTPSMGFNSTTEWIKKVDSVMNNTGTMYHYLKLKEVYDWYPDLDKVKNISEPFGSAEWNNQTADILNTMFIKTTNFLFENFNFEMSKKMADEPDPHVVLHGYFDAYQTVYTFFYAASGAILLLLGVMYAVGKRGKTKEEYAAILVRMLVGVALPCSIIAIFIHPMDEGFAYQQSGWIIAIVTLALLVVIMLDNAINKWVDKKLHRYGDDDDDSSIEKGHGHTRSGSDGHKYNAIHGGHADALAAALHFGKPSSFEHGHQQHHESKNTHTHTRDISHDSNPAHAQDIQEHTPFVGPAHAQSVDFAMYPESQFSSPGSAHHTPSLSQISTSYHAYHKPRADPSASASESYDLADSHIRRVQLYEPTIESPVTTRPGNQPFHHGEA